MLLLFLISLLAGATLSAQTVIVTDNSSYTTGQASAALDVYSTSKGFLVPRMTTAQRTAISSPAQGLMVYQTDGTAGLYYYTNSTWVPLTSGASAAWSLTGNSGSSYATNFLGTTDNTSLRFRTNNTQRMILDSLGNVGIGSAPAWTTGTFQEKFLVDAGTTSSYNAIVARGTINNYFQLNIQNKSNGNTASSDVVATADNGTETVNYVDLGINGSGNSQNVFGNPDDAYLYSTGNNFLIGNATSGQSLVFMTGGTTQSTNERMRITGTGNVGIGTTSPATALHVVGTNPLTMNGVQTGATTDSVLTIASGTVRKLPFSTLTSNASWSLTGNSGTSYATNFLGTTDNTSLRFRTNNTQSMILDSLGHVGIGTAAPATPLHLSASNGNLLYIQTLTSGTANIIFKTYTGSANPTAQIGVTDDGSYSGHITFSTKIPSADANALSERVRITSTGSLGIGTTTPGQKLDVNGTIVSSATTYPNYTYNSANRMAFGEPNVPANETGSVAQFGSGSSSRNMLFAFTKTNVNTSYLGNDGTQMMLGSESTIPITFRTGLVYSSTNVMASGTELMRLTSAGQLGIGTTSPATALHVVGTNPLTLNGVQVGATTDSVLTIASGTVRKLSFTTVTSGTSWSLTGNAGTNYATNFLGTTDNTSLRFRTNNNPGFILDSLGNVGIGSAPAWTTGSAQEKFLVDAGTTSSFNGIVARGTLNNYFQLNIQNRSNGNTASSDVVATADNGTETVNYVDLGINGSGNTQNVFGNPDDAYLYTTGNNFLIGNATAGQSLVFMTGGTTQSTNERMRITGTGNVGIGTTSPATALHVVGTNPLTLNGVQTGATTDSVLTIASGTVRKLPFSTLTSNTSWSLTGNSGTSYATNFLGTTDNTSLRIRTNNNPVMIVDSLGNVGIGTTTASSNLTLYQNASGATTSKGFRLTGSSIGGPNSGTGFAMALGFNIVNNKQLWMGDVDYLGLTSGTFIRYSTSNGFSIIDAIAGDNSVRRPISVGYGADPNSAVILGADLSATIPGSYIWANGNMAIGNGYRSNAAPTNGLLVQGNVGIGTTSPATALHVVGTNPLTLNGVQTGATTDSVLTIASGTVRKLPFSTLTNGTAWSLTGNSGTNYATNFLGTTDNTSLRFRTFNTPGMILDSLGNVGIGNNPVWTTGSAQEKLLVYAGTTNSFNAIVARGTVNNYFQMNIQNQSNGNTGSSDLVATADNGTESVNYVDLGINGSGNTQNVFGNPDDAYLYTTGNNFLIGTGTAGESLVFMTGGTTQSTNERMRINGSGYVGINKTAPAYRLDVHGKSNFDSTVNATGYSSTFQTLTYASSLTWDQTKGTSATVTLTGNATLSITNATAGMYGVLKVVQDAAGSHTLTLPSGSKVINGGGGAVTLTTTANAIDMLSYFYDGTSYYWTIGNNFN